MAYSGNGEIVVAEKIPGLVIVVAGSEGNELQYGDMQFTRGWLEPRLSLPDVDVRDLITAPATTKKTTKEAMEWPPRFMEARRLWGPVIM
ncbi:unnamed protein product [Danaus chrysippus]|uniref:(African queen) hypothetical protein n=1 Tax=Danaus chrysippus TaxID=151541 RepID=A0A8J2QMK6_9NEOP|nr:unnamed protein product [Danaus chrysippus]